MPPYLPIVSLSRSQSTRIGRGPGNQVVPELNSGDTPVNPGTGQLIGPFYADLGDSRSRKDLQHHSAIGAVTDVGSTSLTTYTDLFGSGFAVTNGAGYVLNVAAGIIQSRYSGAQVPVAATTVTAPVAPALGSQTSLVVVSNSGVVSLIPGPVDTVAPTYEVVTLTSSAALTGTYKIAFTWNNFWFTTASINVTAVGSAIATAVLAATGGPNNCALSAYAPGAALAGAGTAMNLSGTTDTLTASAGLEGPFANIQLQSVSVTGGTLTLAVTTVGSGAQGLGPNGSYLVLDSINIPNGGTGVASGTKSGASMMLTS